MYDKAHKKCETCENDQNVCVVWVIYHAGNMYLFKFFKSKQTLKSSTWHELSQNISAMYLYRRLGCMWLFLWGPDWVKLDLLPHQHIGHTERGPRFKVWSETLRCRGSNLQLLLFSNYLCCNILSQTGQNADVLSP